MTWGRSLGIGPEPATLTPLPLRSRLGSKVAVQRGGQHRILASVCVAAGGGEEGPGGRPTPTTQPTRFLLQTSAKPWGFAFPS